ncbi:hypothetical protein OG899_15370 [Streptomyces thermoviolaceus]|uniref:hypothetical protein n=1 Tax=Streptomyces thermoviolaceus TaxID=1952 RepID=UPI0038653F38|nr:hypothetical protein OG899_15370 [Streptomyces thermoviolaceus]
MSDESDITPQDMHATGTTRTATAADAARTGNGEDTTDDMHATGEPVTTKDMHATSEPFEPAQ